jgi:hypothetical protein
VGLADDAVSVDWAVETANRGGAAVGVELGLGVGLVLAAALLLEPVLALGSGEAPVPVLAGPDVLEPVEEDALGAGGAGRLGLAGADALGLAEAAALGLAGVDALGLAEPDALGSAAVRVAGVRCTSPPSASVGSKTSPGKMVPCSAPGAAL